MKSILYILAAMLALTLGACHSSRTANAPGALADSRQPDWTTLYSNIDVSLTAPATMGVSGRATMRRGEYIHVSMRFFGMEVAALYLDADSAYFVDKYHRYLFAEPLKALLGADYDYLTLADIQSVILGQKLLPENGAVTTVPSGFVETPAGLVASVLTLNADTPQGRIGGRLEWSPDRAKWNEPDRNVSFSVPSNYQRISADALRNMLKNMRL